MFKTKETSEMTAVEIAHLWQDFRKWCVERAIDAKATAADDNIVSTAETIAKYVITKDELEKSTEEKKEI